MTHSGNGRETPRIRSEILVALKMLYPAALKAEQLLRSLLVLFPTLEFDAVKRDLHYVCAKEYVERVLTDSERDGTTTPWRRRWFRLSPRGVEAVDRCIHNPAMEE